MLLPPTHPEHRQLVQIQACFQVRVQAYPPCFEYTQTGTFPQGDLATTGRLLLALAQERERPRLDLAYPHYVRFDWQLAQAQLLSSYVWLAQCRSAYGEAERRRTYPVEPPAPKRYTYTDLCSASSPNAPAYLETNIRVFAYDTARRVVSLEISDELRGEVEKIPLSVIVSWTELLQTPGSLALKCAYVLYLKSAQLQREYERFALEPALAYRHWQAWDS